MPASKEVKQILRKLDRNRIPYQRTKGSHYRIPTPDGGWITMASTPSDSRSLPNIRAKIRRCLHIDV